MGTKHVRRLRTSGYTRPIVALTAHAALEDRKKCLDAGCNYYVAKPINRDELMRVAADLIGGPGKAKLSSSQTMAAEPHDALPTAGW